MPGCILRVQGIEFDVDAFLAGSSLRPYSIFRRGEIDVRSRPCLCSGFGIIVGGSHGVLKADVADAIQFLAADEAELASLRDFPGVTSIDLDFGYYRRDVLAQYDYLPNELLRLVGGLGMSIVLSQYVSSDTEEDP